VTPCPPSPRVTAVPGGTCHIPHLSRPGWRVKPDTNHQPTRTDSGRRGREPRHRRHTDGRHHRDTGRGHRLVRPGIGRPDQRGTAELQHPDRLREHRRRGPKTTTSPSPTGAATRCQPRTWRSRSAAPPSTTGEQSRRPPAGPQGAYSTPPRTPASTTSGAAPASLPPTASTSPRTTPRRTTT